MIGFRIRASLPEDAAGEFVLRVAFALGGQGSGKARNLGPQLAEYLGLI
jgi:hypothetical protein